MTNTTFSTSVSNTITVLFFAQLREELNCDSLDVELSEPCSVSELKDRLIELHPNWNNVFKHSPFLASINQTLADVNDTVQPGSEVAFFPPVTGG